MEVKIKGVKELEERLTAYLKKLETDPDLAKVIGDLAVQQIRGGVKAGNGEYKVDAASKGTQDRRKELAKYNQTDDAYRNKKSLTFTGELLNSLSYEIKNKIVTLFFKGTHKPYQGKNGPIGIAETNAEIARKVQEKRPFLFLSEKLKKRLETELVREVRRRISTYQALKRKIGDSNK